MRLSPLVAVLIAALASSAAGQERGWLKVQRLLPPEEARANGHPKLVAMLVGEDYSRGPGRPDWGAFGTLPGVWQDLARMQRRLKALGFGKIVVLGGNQAKGSVREVPLQAIPNAVEEPAGSVPLAFDGPATRKDMVEAAGRLKDHLNASRTADDGHGGEVPPLLVFYYSGHGFVSAQGTHCLPLADNLAGEPTGALLKLLLETVGADDPARGAAGGGSSLVFLDCCQAGKAVQAAAKGGPGQGGLLESELMDAIRAGRRGRFLVGASLGDEQAREGASGGHFTSALCASLSPDALGRGREGEVTLSLNHLVLEVDRKLLAGGSQAVSKYPPPGEVAWDNYVLFANPHRRVVREPVRLYVTTVPPGARVQAEDGGVFRDLEGLSGGFFRDEALSRGDRQVYQVPEPWRGRRIPLRAVPSGAEDRVAYEASAPAEVTLEAEASGAPPMVALALKDVRNAGGAASQDALLSRAMKTYEEALKQPDPMEGYRGFQVSREIWHQVNSPVKGAMVPAIDQALATLKPKAAEAQLTRAIDRARAPEGQDRYREAYDRLKEVQAGAGELKEFGLDAAVVADRVEAARAGVLAKWRTWAEAQRKRETEQRLAQGELFLNSGQPWQSWRLGMEAGILSGEDPRVRGLSQRSQDQAVEGIFTQKVNLETLVSNGAYGILADLTKGADQVPLARTLQRILQDRYRVTGDTLRARMDLDRARFVEMHADWFPPELRIATKTISTPSAEMVLIPAGEFLMGSPAGEGSDNEHPQHRVYVDAYYIDKTEVTNRQYAEFVRRTSHRAPESADWGKAAWNTWNGQDPASGHEDHPVVGVSWADADAYCRWAEKRLPTEAEWEKAARGTDGRKYPWGNEEYDAEGRYRANIGPGGDREVWRRDGYEYTAPVGRYPSGSSPYGVLDMAGNVWEWCADWYDGNYYGISPTSNPQGPGSGQYRVLRGGSWNTDPDDVRAAYRGWGTPPDRTSDRGFRCSRTLTP